MEFPSRPNLQFVSKPFVLSAIFWREQTVAATSRFKRYTQEPFTSVY